jgi:xylulokinase
VAAKRVALGIDQGSSGARAVVMTSQGEVLGSGRAPCRDLRRTPMGTRHDAGSWLDESLSAARSALRDAGCDKVDAIGVGALGPAPVVVDAELRPLVASPLFPIDVPAWVDALPADLASRGAWVLDVAGFLVGTLVGRPVMDRITAADHVVEGEPARIAVPDAREPFEIAGELTPALGERLGLVPGIPVAVGTYDTFVDLAGIGVTEPGSAAILLGSTVIVGVVREEPDAPDELRSSPHVGPGWFVGGWTSTAGRALGWAASLAAESDRERVVAEAAAMEPGGAGVLALPYLDGERAPVWDPAARGAVLGLTTSTTLAQIYRGVLDGVVLSTLDLADRLGPVRGGAPWTVAGGGVRDAAWVQSTADALGEPLTAVDLPDAAAAARAGFASIGEPLPPPAGRTVEPDANDRGRWQELAAVYRGMYEVLADRMHRLGALADDGAPA